MNSVNFRDLADRAVTDPPLLQLNTDELMRRGRRTVRRRAALTALPALALVGVVGVGLSTVDLGSNRSSTLATAPTAQAGPSAATVNEDAERAATLARLLADATSKLETVAREEPLSNEGAAMATAVVRTKDGQGTVAVRVVTGADELAGPGPCVDGCATLAHEAGRRVLLEMTTAPGGARNVSVFVVRDSGGYAQASASTGVRGAQGERIVGGNELPLTTEELRRLAEAAEAALR